MEKRFYWLYVSVFINIVSFGMTFPILPLFAQSFNATSFQVGLLTSAFALMQFLFAPLVGKFSDRYGRRPIFIWAIATSTVALFVIGNAHSLFMLFVGMALLGLAGAGILPTALAYIADITDGHKRSKYISRVTGTFALGFMVGPIVGGIFGSTSLSLPYIIAGCISLVNLLIIILLLKETHDERDERLALKDGFISPKSLLFAAKGEFGVLFFLLFAWAFYIANFSLTIPFFTAEKYGFGALENGLFFSVVGCIAGVTQWFILPSLEKKFGDVSVIFWGILLTLIGQALVFLAVIPPLFYLFFMITVVGSALMRPSTNALLSKRTTGGQGTTMGLAFSFESLGRILGPIILGLIIVNFGVTIPFLVTALVLVLALVLFYKFEYKKKTHRQALDCGFPTFLVYFYPVITLITNLFTVENHLRFSK